MIPYVTSCDDQNLSISGIAASMILHILSNLRLRLLASNVIINWVDQLQLII